MLSAPWHLQIHQFLFPKDNSNLAECEDAIGINMATGRFAIADGATEAFDARRWAEMLARDWVRREEMSLLAAHDFHAWVDSQGEQLHAAWRERSLPWYVEEKARRGSFAAFLGLQFEREAMETKSSARLPWRAIALGDSCLVQRRGARVCATLPLTDAEAFNSCPPLVPSVVHNQEAAWAQFAVGRGVMERDDVLWLFSDAIAAWYLRTLAANDLAMAERFESWLVSAERDNLIELLLAEKRAARLRDDDCAIVRLTIERLKEQ